MAVCLCALTLASTKVLDFAEKQSTNTDAYTALTVKMDYLADDSVLAHIYVACRSALLLLPLSALLPLPLSAHVAHMCLIPKQALLFF